MRQKIENFNEIIESYYAEKGNDGVFHFLHVEVPITYRELHHKYVDSDGTIKERPKKIQRTKTVYVPALVDKKYYNDNFLNKEYGKDLKPLRINAVIDIGTTDEFNYQEFYERVYSYIPKECRVITKEELELIATLNGYDDFEWEIYDAAYGKPVDNYHGQEWHTSVYGVWKTDIFNKTH